jgi:hypothetical protein
MEIPDHIMGGLALVKSVVKLRIFCIPYIKYITAPNYCFMEEAVT